MRVIAQQIATDPFIKDWFAQGRSAEGEAHLLAKLSAISTSHNLSKTSFADRLSGHYWNQDGYLRQLKNDNVDGWFFAYRESGKASSVSIYAYPDSDQIDLFVNYQEVNGKGLAGIAKSFEDIVNLLSRFTLEETGFVYLVNQDGIIQLHWLVRLLIVFIRKILPILCLISRHLVLMKLKIIRLMFLLLPALFLAQIGMWWCKCHKLRFLPH